MRPSILSLLLALTATVVVASPKRQRHTSNTALSNSTATSSASTATSSTSGGCDYIHVIGPNESNIYTGCQCANGDTGTKVQPAFIFNLTETPPPCTPGLDPNHQEYFSVGVEPGDPGLALCNEAVFPAWALVGDVSGDAPQIEPYVGLCG